MLNLFEIITIPLGYIIDAIYKFVPNYGLSIIIFTLIIKLILLPLNIKSQKSMKKTAKIQPALQELQKKYANDKERLNSEMMKLYKDNGVSMTGGCLPLLVQFPILIGLYRVIQRPITYLLHVSITDTGVVEKITNIVALMKEKFPEELGAYANTSAETLFKNAQIQLATWSEKVLDAAQAWKINFNFLGLNLSQVPSSGLSALLKGNFEQIGTVALIIIPILAVFTTWLSTKQTQAMSGQNKDNQTSETAQMTGTMNLMMPLMTGFFTLTLPSGMGIYWITSNVIQMIQQFCLNKYFENKEDDFVVKVRNQTGKKRKKHR